MLFIIDNLLQNAPSNFINWVTFGSKGATLCGRLYLYKKYVSDQNHLVNFLIWAIDSIEPGHCEKSARHWRVKVRRYSVFFPMVYLRYMEVRQHEHNT